MAPEGNYGRVNRRMIDGRTARCERNRMREREREIIIDLAVEHSELIPCRTVATGKI